jgi:predicted transposase YdaD
MLIYSVAIREKFEKFPTQIVLFVGKGNPPPSVFKSEFTIHKFKVVDMKKIDPDEFIRSDKPEEVIIGILAGKFKDKPEIIRKVKKRILEIVKDEKEIAKYIDSISFLAGLFDIEIEVKPMPIQVDIRKTFLYKWGEEEGEKRGFENGKKEGKQEGLREGLKKAILLDAEAKFGISKARQIKKLLDKINEINRLEKIKREVIRAESWENFVKSIKNSKSKNKV